MTKKEEILAYCIKENRKLTAKDILSALYPGKPQPYINTQINELIAERKLIREETDLIRCMFRRRVKKYGRFYRCNRGEPGV